MYGYITWTDALRRPSAGEYEVMKMRMCRVAIPGRKGLPQFVKRGMAVRAARLLRECGITRAVFPELFPYLDIFEQYRIAPADPMAVYRVLAGRLVQARLDVCGQSGKGIVVAVCAKKLTEEVRRTVTELCIRNRYVMLVSPEQDDGFCRKLRREYGVPLVQTADMEQMRKAAVIVRFSPEMPAGEEQEVIDLFAGGTPLKECLRVPEEWEAHLPDECDKMQMLAALHGCGILRPGDIRILYDSVQESG